jgi:hypothetical protein
VFAARYALSPYIKQIRFVFKGLIQLRKLQTLTADFRRHWLSHKQLLQLEQPLNKLHFRSSNSNFRFACKGFRVPMSGLTPDKLKTATSQEHLGQFSDWATQLQSRWCQELFNLSHRPDQAGPAGHAVSHPFETCRSSSVEKTATVASSLLSSVEVPWRHI